MAELERSVIRERVVAGLEYARRHGTKSGKPIGRPRAVFDRSAAVRLRAEGKSWGYIALRLKTSVASVRRAWQAATREEVAQSLRLSPEAMPKSLQTGVEPPSTQRSGFDLGAPRL